MPNRIIRDSCKTSGSLDLLTDRAERLFWRLVTVADDYGRFKADPRLVLAAAFPLKISKWTTDEIEPLLQEMASKEAGILHLYESDGQRFAQFLNWERHQTVRAKQSRFPAPDLQRDLLNADDHVIGIGIGSEIGNGIGAESRKEAAIANVERQIVMAWFDDIFWLKYPRKVGKDVALKAMLKLNPDKKTRADIMAALEWQLESEGHLAREEKFQPHAATWINGHRFKDERPRGGSGWRPKGER